MMSKLWSLNSKSRSKMQRRQFIQSAFLSGMMLNASGTLSAQNSPFGELRADPRKILDLPKGFGYTIISEQHSLMDDGLLTPGQADGMAAFQNKNGNIMVFLTQYLSDFLPSLPPPLVVDPVCFIACKIGSL